MGCVNGYFKPWMFEITSLLFASLLFAEAHPVMDSVCDRDAGILICSFASLPELIWLILFFCGADTDLFECSSDCSWSRQCWDICYDFHVSGGHSIVSFVACLKDFPFLGLLSPCHEVELCTLTAFHSWICADFQDILRLKHCSVLQLCPHRLSGASAARIGVCYASAYKVFSLKYFSTSLLFT